MKEIVQRLVLGASITAGMSAIAIPAQAGSLTNVTISGSAASDYLVYGVQGNNTVRIPSNLTNVQQVLDGNAQSPTGNVELRASSEQSNFNFSQNTTLSGTINGEILTLSSLTASDWFGTGTSINTTYGANTLATRWFNDFLVNAGKGNLVGTSLATSAFNLFVQIRGFQRTSDPNISYVNQDDTTGFITIGLAGHFDLKAYYSSPNSGFATFAKLLPNGFQASEVVKYTYNGVTDYLYSFRATRSGLTASEGTDTQSHSGNYEVGFQGIVPASTPTPEPSVVLGLAGIVGFVVTKRKSKKVFR
ncbi:NF038130 family PEP-CTERM protein [Anabaena azotica]|uniref:NF038130 family PEP-CTERM protein n=1 Tax=Anabaena azotica FACHB-119 TaxID=947527 RepID=A0ABR8D5W2_9NOST|nr:NF038130 family PEP-CTERM protein [Anabaena azotica]MBD2502530.1 NF038130 family PEP-CTERM protein [Anabaena azotica FACHB-119]